MALTYALVYVSVSVKINQIIASFVSACVYSIFWKM